ncbi:MAG: HIT domain-containing protein [Taibaiella sp.]|nr:HIT domain-containing protein [Taibaiella sp.]
MNYNELKVFLVDKMKMSHIYQPIMIKCLLRNRGVASDADIAKEISLQDPSQIEYYQNITNNMVGRVLRGHHVVVKEKKVYKLNGYSDLKAEEITELINICNEKLTGYIEKRGGSIWQHRTKSRTPISGSIKYEVLKRARFRCELCGSMDSEKALEVDHIVPKNLGGEDSINNYQALCYSCNAMKRDHDSTDFRGLNKEYEHRVHDCIFCKIETKRIVSENNLAYLIYDQYPVTQHHMLIIPKRHFGEYFEMYQPELNAIQDLLFKGKEMVNRDDKSVKGFNIGINSGMVAGQTIFHCHTHLIPRRTGDVENPSGGVRHIIKGKGFY